MAIPYLITEILLSRQVFSAHILVAAQVFVIRQKKSGRHGVHNCRRALTSFRHCHKLVKWRNKDARVARARSVISGRKFAQKKKKKKKIKKIKRKERNTNHAWISSHGLLDVVSTSSALTADNRGSPAQKEKGKHFKRLSRKKERKQI